MNPTDTHFVMTAGHWFWSIMITGGGAGAVIAWWLASKNKKKGEHPHMVALEKHIAEDNIKFTDGSKRFDEVNRHLEKQYDLLVTVSGDIGKVKGKLGID